MIELPITIYYDNKRAYLSALSKIQNRYVECDFCRADLRITEYVLMKDEEED